MSRTDLFKLVCNEIGPAAKIIDAGAGWPGLATILTATGLISVSLHVSTVGSHARQTYEKRFQNPGDRRPVRSIKGSVPILVGVAEVSGAAVLVVVDGRSRLGREARFSILFLESILADAALEGWAEYTSSTGEKITALHPKLFPVFLDMLRTDTFPDSRAIVTAAVASGLIDSDDENSAQRARSVITRLRRDQAFSQDVRDAYDGRCAMCNLGLKLVVGAHILPVSIPGSPDKVWNGIALCHNHHTAFDKFYIWVEPTKGNIRVRPDILSIAATDEAAMVFCKNTRERLALPSQNSHRPKPQMFEKRYEVFEEQYNW